MQNNKLMIKARLGRKGDEIRRLTVDAPASFAAFQSALDEALALKTRFPDGFTVKYEDEESDMVTMVTDSDLRECMRQVAISDDNLLRLSISGTSSSSRCKERKEQRRASAGAGCCPAMGGGHPLAGLLSQLQCGLPELLSNPNIRSMAEGLVNANAGLVKIVTNFACDHCQSQICGDRFASTTQQNFDLCSNCMLSSVGQELEKTHKFKKVSAFEALMECLKAGGTFDAAFEKEDPSAPARHRAICDVCSAPIVGVRHKCLECADYDECDACRSASKHEHEMYAICDPSVRRIPEEVMAEYAAAKATPGGPAGGQEGPGAGQEGPGRGRKGSGRGQEGRGGGQEECVAQGARQAPCRSSAGAEGPQRL